MFRSRNVAKGERKEKDPCYPSVDRRRWLEVRIIDHSFDVTGINLEEEMVDSDEVTLGVVEGAKDTEEFALGLGVVALGSIPGAREESHGVSNAVGAKLRQYSPEANVRRVNREDDIASGAIVKSAESWAGSDGRL